MKTVLLFVTVFFLAVAGVLFIAPSELHFDVPGAALLKPDGGAPLAAPRGDTDRFIRSGDAAPHAVSPRVRLLASPFEQPTYSIIREVTCNAALLPDGTRKGVLRLVVDGDVPTGIAPGRILRIHGFWCAPGSAAAGLPAPRAPPTPLLLGAVG